MSAIQKGRYNESNCARKKRKERRRLERFYYTEALPDSKPSWLDRYGNLAVEVACMSTLIAMLLYVLCKIITSG